MYVEGSLYARTAHCTCTNYDIQITKISKLTSEIPISIPNTEVFQNTHTEYRTDMKNTNLKPNNENDSKFRYPVFVFFCFYFFLLLLPMAK